MYLKNSIIYLTTIRPKQAVIQDFLWYNILMISSDSAPNGDAQQAGHNVVELPDRAHWQRSEAMLLFSELTDICFDDAMSDSGEWIPKDEINSGVGPLSQFVAIGEALHKRTQQALTDWLATKDDEQFKKLNPALGLHTFHGRLQTSAPLLGDNDPKRPIEAVAHEGFSAAVTYPANLLRDLSKNGHVVVDDLSGISDVLRQSWFVELCEKAAETGNGYWGTASVQFYEPVKFRVPPDKDGVIALGFPGETKPPYKQESDGSVDFDDWVKSALRKYLLMVNKSGGANSSSGCPVRHHRPYLEDTVYDAESMETLSELFDKPVDELVKVRPTSGIAKAVGCLAHLTDPANNL